jgi:hypothetical protein
VVRPEVETNARERSIEALAISRWRRLAQSQGLRCLQETGPESSKSRRNRKKLSFTRILCFLNARL